MTVYGCAAAVALGASLFAYADARSASFEPVDFERTAELIVDYVNAARAANGTAPVVANIALTRAARSFAEFMATSDQHGHEVDGRTPAMRVKQHGYDYCLVAENIGFQFRSSPFSADPLARGFVDGWSKSPGHRANMLDADVLDSGAAVARSARTGRYYAVQLFARPAAATIEVRVVNATDARIAYRLGQQTYELPVRATRAHRQCRVGTYLLLNGAKAERAEIRPYRSTSIRVETQAGGLRWAED